MYDKIFWTCCLFPIIPVLKMGVGGNWALCQHLYTVIVGRARLVDTVPVDSGSLRHVQFVVNRDHDFVILTNLDQGESHGGKSCKLCKTQGRDPHILC